MGKVYYGKNNFKVKGEILYMVEKGLDLTVIMDNGIIINLENETHTWEIKGEDLYFDGK